MGVPAVENRQSLRFNVALPVLVSAEGFRTHRCIARNISAGGMFLETEEPLPLCSQVRVHFVMERGQGEIVARAEVKNHYYLTFNDGNGVRGVVGMGVKFLEFEKDTDEPLKTKLTRYKTLH
jgi:hypothetical protein